MFDIKIICCAGKECISHTTRASVDTVALILYNNHKLEIHINKTIHNKFEKENVWLWTTCGIKESPYDLKVLSISEQTFQDPPPLRGVLWPFYGKVMDNFVSMPRDIDIEGTLLVAWLNLCGTWGVCPFGSPPQAKNLTSDHVNPAKYQTHYCIIHFWVILQKWCRHFRSHRIIPNLICT